MYFLSEDLNIQLFVNLREEVEGNPKFIYLLNEPKIQMIPTNEKAYENTYAQFWLILLYIITILFLDDLECTFSVDFHQPLF